MESLMKNNLVRMKDPIVVENKLSSLSTDGPAKLQIVSDFDYTLSRAHLDGRRCETCHGIFRKGDRDQLNEQLTALYHRYCPIEFSADMTMEEKIPHMVEWWKSAHALILDAGFTKSELRSVVVRSDVHLRGKARDFINSTQRLSIPLIVFSAGISDFIEMLLENELGSLPENVHVISNKMMFSEDPELQSIGESSMKLVGFSNPLIHTFNKNASVLSASSRDALAPRLDDRTNVLLVGDSLGDIHMDCGISVENVALKIGFLNFDRPDLVDQYLEAFDIVIMDDQTMAVPIEILNWIVEGGGK